MGLSLSNSAYSAIRFNIQAQIELQIWTSGQRLMQIYIHSIVLNITFEAF